MTLEKRREAVLSEFERLLPLMQDGGHRLMPDHTITPPLRNGLVGREDQ